MLCTPDASFLGVYCGDVFQSKMGNVPASENRRYKHVRLNVLMTRNLLARQRIACTGDCEVDFHRRYGFSGFLLICLSKEKKRERDVPDGPDFPGKCTNARPRMRTQRSIWEHAVQTVYSAYLLVRRRNG